MAQDVVGAAFRRLRSVRTRIQQGHGHARQALDAVVAHEALPRGVGGVGQLKGIDGRLSRTRGWTVSHGYEVPGTFAASLEDRSLDVSWAVALQVLAVLA